MVGEWGIDPGKIDLIYLGARNPDDDGSEKPLVVPDSWDGRFLFTAGSIRPARGLEDLMRALGSLKSSPFVAGLVIAGQVDGRMERYKTRLDRYISREGLSAKIVWADTLDAAQMSWCYDHCLAFVMTSRVEACPNIALEAMAHGCACIASDNAPLPEIFGEGALYYPPKNGEALAKMVVQTTAFADVEALAKSRQVIARSKSFSWEKCAAQTVDVFRHVYGKHA
jgi:glycosyltransferase involved in cell wall biosynthesis